MAYDLLGESDLGALMGDDLMGDDLMGDDLMGGMGQRRGGLRRPPLLNKVQGVTPTSVGRLPLGFGTLSLGVGGTGGTLTARPQVPWRGEKLICSITGTHADNYAVTLQPIIGNRPVLAGAATIDARAFPANGLGNELIAEGAGPGIDVTFNITVTPAIGAGDTVQVTPTWIGNAIV